MSWKREQIPDHKFDFVDEKDFIQKSITSKLSYMLVFVYTLKDIIVYMADVASISILVYLNKDVISDGRSDFQFTATPVIKDKKFTRFPLVEQIGGVTVLFYLLIASLLVSFILLGIEWRKATAIIRSRDISYAFTSVIAYRYYAIRSYAHYCLFEQIQNSRKTTDVVAFWVFFRFKRWKRLILAEFPRQFLQGLILAAAYTQFGQDKNGLFPTIGYMINGAPDANGVPQLDQSAKFLLALQAFTVTVWLVTFMGLFIAFLIYIPLVSVYIRGNLKEYCVHKVDKRIAEILKRKSRKRLHEARKNERDRIVDGSVTGQNPTLPNIDVDLDDVQYSQDGHSNYGAYSQAGYSYAHGYGRDQYSQTGYQDVNGGYSQSPYNNNTYALTKNHSNV